MSDVTCYSLFCEEIRWEANGAPMLLGMMPPVFHPSGYPFTFARLSLVTFIKCEADRDEIDARMTLWALSSQGEEKIGTFGASYTKHEADEGAYQWVSVSTLPIDDFEFEEGKSLKAVVEIEGRESISFLTAGSCLKSEDD